MYSTCIYCHASLGTNDAVEHFPIGRRLAFDVERGRLWAICRSCGNWNLAPLEERWEAIEECEVLFRATPTRHSTRNIGLGYVPRGLELIRVGGPAYPEFAAWRYGRQLSRRRTRAVVGTTVAATVGTAAVLLTGTVVAALATVVGVAAVVPLLLAWDSLEHRLLQDHIVARVRPPDGHVRELLEEHIGRIELVAPYAGAAWGISVAHRTGTFVVRGADATRIASQLLARVNRRGASARQLSEAIDLLQREGGSDEYIAWATGSHDARRVTGEVFHDPGLGAFGLTDVECLALEMAVNEEVERRAVQGELDDLRAGWRDAEEIAGIADDLLVPGRVRRALKRLRSAAMSRSSAGQT